MVATLIKKNDCWYCSNCRIRQFAPKPYCDFCRSEISNIEDIWLELYKQKTDISFSNQEQLAAAYAVG